jgi:DNA processing protein
LASELVYQIALTLVPNIGNVHAKSLVQHFGSAKEVFSAPKKALDHIEGIGTVRSCSLKRFTDFKRAEDELQFIEKYKITPLFLTDERYPKRLLNCYDSPVMLYYKGNADLNHSKVIAIVGTRQNDEYGKHVCERLIEDLAEQDIMIVSGLAYGIDSIAHKAALNKNLPTIGVLAHGLDRVYPYQNSKLAKRMITNGGLLTEFKSLTNPDRQNFPFRNRIVAGMSDATIVVETGIKGGSLITAELANNYNKDVFAFPGRIGDVKNEGCNYLIKANKAALITCGDDLLENMNWNKKKIAKPVTQKKLFIELNENEKKVVKILQNHDQVHIDELHLKSDLGSSEVAAALLMLEMQGIITSIPGKIYKMT